MIFHHYLAVIGRVSGDENDIITFENMTTHQAAEAATKLLIENASRDYEIAPEDVYIDYILSSDSPISTNFVENP